MIEPAVLLTLAQPIGVGLIDLTNERKDFKTLKEKACNLGNICQNSVSNEPNLKFFFLILLSLYSHYFSALKDLLLVQITPCHVVK